MTKDTISNTRRALRDASKRNVLPFASDDYSKAASLLRAAEDNLKLGRADEAQLLASVALQRADHAAREADAGAKGFTTHIVGFESTLHKQVSELTSEIDAHVVKLPAEMENACRMDLRKAAAALTRCAGVRKSNQWLRAKGETVSAEQIIQHVRMTLDLARTPEKPFGSLKTNLRQTLPHVKGTVKDRSVKETLPPSPTVCNEQAHVGAYNEEPAKYSDRFRSESLMPQQAIDAAKSSIDAARAASAGQFADADLYLAETLLLSAVAHKDGGDVTKARLYAQKAKEQAELAVSMIQQKRRGATHLPGQSSRE
jgi:hypothetical protein